MTVINKQKFLAELGKLLTFMYEEDRQIALGLYENMFDTCGNEQLLLQHLGTPTRQAVMVARSYNSRDRKLQISSDSRSGEDEAQDPQYISVIQNVERAFSTRYGNTQQEEVSEDQISLFETFDFITAPEEEPLVEEPEQTSLFDLLDEPAESFIQEQPAAEENNAAEEEFSEPKLADEFFLEETAEELPAAEEEVEPAEQPEIQEADFVEYSLESVQSEELEAEEAEEDEDEAEEPERIPTVRKVKPAMLLVYILLAIPAILVGTAVLLVPTVLFLLAATAAVILGILIVSFPFGGLTVFADIMLVLGVGIIVLALGFLFLWTFVWLIGGAIVGYIQGVIRLGGKLCYKEVPVK